MLSYSSRMNEIWCLESIAIDSTCCGLLSMALQVYLPMLWLRTYAMLRYLCYDAMLLLASCLNTTRTGGKNPISAGNANIFRRKLGNSQLACIQSRIHILNTTGVWVDRFSRFIHMSVTSVAASRDFQVFAVYHAYPNANNGTYLNACTLEILGKHLGNTWGFRLRNSQIYIYLCMQSNVFIHACMYVYIYAFCSTYSTWHIYVLYVHVCMNSMCIMYVHYVWNICVLLDVHCMCIMYVLVMYCVFKCMYST